MKTYGKKRCESGHRFVGKRPCACCILVDRVHKASTKALRKRARQEAKRKCHED